MEPEGVVPVDPTVDPGRIDLDIGDTLFLAALAEVARSTEEGVVVSAAYQHQLAGILGAGDAVDGGLFGVPLVPGLERSETR